MELIVPEYYQHFRCIAAACPDSCCKEWAVDVDDDTAARYRELPGALGDRLRQVLKDTADGTVMTIENGRCPMWRDDGLCRIQAELGHEALCRVCQEYPRLQHDYGDLVELGLELSCPEAARLILSADFDKITVTQMPDAESSDDPETLNILYRSRTEALTFLSEGTYSLPETLAVLLLYAYDVQEELDGGSPAVFRPEDCLAQGRRYAKPGDLCAVYSFFQRLEILTSKWRTLLEIGPTSPVWSARIRNLAQYLIRRYWLQAMADLDLVCRVKFIIAACLMVASIPGDTVNNAQLFSKEIENDPDNLERILDAAYTSPALTDAHLLGLLLCP